MKNRNSFLGLLFVAPLAAACAKPPEAQFPSAAAALERLSESTSCSRAVRAEAKLSFAGDGRRLNGKLLYQAHAPDQLRFDIFSPFGVTISTLTSNGERFSLYSIEDKTFLAGPAKSCNVARFTQVPVPTFAFVELLRGRAPVLAHQPEDAEIRFVRPFLEQGYYEIRIKSQHGATEVLRLQVPKEQYGLALTEQRLELTYVSVSQNEKELYRVVLGDYQRPPQQASASSKGGKSAEELLAQKAQAEQELQAAVEAANQDAAHSGDQASSQATSHSGNQASSEAAPHSGDQASSQAASHSGDQASSQAADGGEFGYFGGELAASGPICDAALPGQLRIFVPQTGYTLGLTNQQIEHNPPLAPGSFEQVQPAGTTAYHADCEEN